MRVAISPATQSATTNTARVFSSGEGNLISISDVDAQGGTMQVQLVSTNGTTTLSLHAYNELTRNRLVGEGSALAILTFVIVMAVSFLYIRFVGGNIRAMAEES